MCRRPSELLRRSIWEAQCTFVPAITRRGHASRPPSKHASAAADAVEAASEDAGAVEEVTVADEGDGTDDNGNGKVKAGHETKAREEAGGEDVLVVETSFGEARLGGCMGRSTASSSRGAGRTSQRLFEAGSEALERREAKKVRLAPRVDATLCHLISSSFSFNHIVPSRLP